jgi:DNA-binding transcriptional ArsR family regulator
MAQPDGRAGSTDVAERPVPPELPAEDALVELTDPRAIRAIAHPARLAVLDALYDQGRQLTATEAAELAGITPSAMSYHLRALERFGMVRHAEPTGDARERPWRRVAKDLVIKPPAATNSKAVASAAGAVISVAMDVMRQRLLATLARGVPVSAGAMSLESLARYSQTTLVVTPEEAATLLRELDELIEPLRAEHRADAPEGAGQVSLAVVMIPDTEGTGAEPSPEPRS